MEALEPLLAAFYFIVDTLSICFKLNSLLALCCLSCCLGLLPTSMGTYRISIALYAS